MAADYSEIIERLDRIQATLSIAFAAQIAEYRERVREDAVNAAILDAATDWVGSTELQETVSKKLSVTTRTVRDRFPSLIANGILQARGSDARPEYRATGLI
jgi:hypothetical protein